MSDVYRPVAESAARALSTTFAGDTDTPESALISYPRPAAIVEALTILIDVLLPGRFFDWDTGDGFVAQLEAQIHAATRLLAPEIEKAIPYRWIGAAARAEGAAAGGDIAADAIQVVTRFLETLTAVRTSVVEDVRAAYDGDPSALTYAEVKLAFPGMLAVVSHRIAHELYKLNVPIVPRLMSEWTHTQTGVDINPGARIGQGFFIDHGTGVVIGETTIIGDRVKIYQGVTLGARSFALDDRGFPIKHIKRHPTVEHDVVIYANAIILGGDTVIGAGSTIGGGVFLMDSVPPGSFVAAKRPELHIKRGETV